MFVITSKKHDLIIFLNKEEINNNEKVFKNNNIRYVLFNCFNSVR